MRPIRALIVYLILVFLAGGLAGPWLYWLAERLAARHWPYFTQLAANPFHRFVDRALLGAALAGLWPLLGACGMRRVRDLGLTPLDGWMARVFFGFLTGFGSLACVALAALALGGRACNPTLSSGQLAGHAAAAALAALAVSVIEEILFRGALFGILRRALSWPCALAVSSAVYALAHFLQKAEPPGPITWLSGLALLPKMMGSSTPFLPAVMTLFVAGAVLALAYQRTGTLFFSMGLHSGWIFWLKSYGMLTVRTPGGNPALWGTEKLIDGWLPLPVLCLVFWLVWKTRIAGKNCS